MNKVRFLTKIAMAASAFAALTFTASCSDNSGPEKPNLADYAEDFQVYMEDDCPGTCPFSPFDGNGVIRIGVYDYDADGYAEFKDFIPFGVVDEGKGTLEFSAEIPGIYFGDDFSMKIPYAHFENDFLSSISVSPRNAKVFIADELYFISGYKAYSLVLDNEYEVVTYAYATQAATLKGSFTEQGITVELDLNVNKGWNAIMYARATRNSIKMSSDPSMVNLNSMKWRASGRGSATFYGGPDAGSIDHSQGDYCDFRHRCISIQELHEEIGYAESCEDAYISGTTVHSCPETIDGYCIIFDFCSIDNDRVCNYWGGIFSIDMPPECE